MQSAKLTTGYIVDDSDSVRERLVSLLGTVDNIAVIGEARSAPEAIAGILATRPDFVLLDVNLGLGRGNGIDVLNTVHHENPAIEFVVLTNHSEPQYRRAYMKAGAKYFLDKSSEFDSVRTVIADIAALTRRPP